MCFGIPKKTLPASHEQIQLFETCNISMYIIITKRKETKKKKNEENIQFTAFWKTCSIKKHFKN